MNRSLRKSPVKLLLGLLFIAPLASLAYMPRGDSPYLQEDAVTSRLKIIISEQYKKDAPFIRQYSRRLFKEYESVFPGKPSQKSFLVFVSPHLQNLGGKATVLPLPLLYIYSNVDHINKAAIHNWLQDSLSHEMAHLYQQNLQTKLSRWLHFLMPPFLWPVYPNIYLHKLILEGNAVLLESIYGSGGRLFSGWNRAFVFSQLKKNIPLKRIFNDYADLESLHEKYLHGGYFFAYLMEKHDLRTINSLFDRHKENIFFPIGAFSLNWVFKKTFGDSFQNLFKQYRAFYLPEALKQNTAKGKVLITSKTAAPLNSDSERIYFMISDRKTSPSLVILNKKTLQLSTKKRDMPVGKVFSIKGSFYSAGTGRTSTLISETSLFKTGYIPLREYNSHYVMDIQSNRSLSFATDQGPLGFPLYVNESFYGFAESTAVMDKKGNVYYFRQNKNRRTLYHNKTPLWSFEGYYSFPLEAKRGKLYFIGPTRYGSSLFVYKKGSVARLSPSDTIVSGRKINEKQFLVSEIDSQGYNYKIIALKKTNQLPYSYQYNFKKRFDFQILPKKLTKNKLAVKQDSKRNALKKSKSLWTKTKHQKSSRPISISSKYLLPHREESVSESSSYFRSYKSLTNLKFQHFIFIPFIVRFSSPFIKFRPFLQLQFTDPLQYNRLSFSGSFENKGKAGQIKYSYRKYRPVLSLQYRFKTNPLIYMQSKTKNFSIQSLEAHKFYDLVKEVLLKESLLQISSYNLSKINLSVEYPIIQRENWHVSFSTLVGLGKESLRLSSIPIIKNEKNQLVLLEDPLEAKKTAQKQTSRFLHHKSKIQFEYEKKYLKSFSKYRYLNLSFYYDSSYLKTGKPLYRDLAGRLSFDREFGTEWYFESTGKWTHYKKTPFMRKPFLKNQSGAPWKGAWHSFRLLEEANGHLEAHFTLKKVLNQQLSSIKLPVSLKRWAPVSGLSFLSLLTDKKNSNRQFINSFIGSEFELSFNHKADAFAGASGGHVWELKNFKKKRSQGFHFGTYFKVFF